MLSDNLFYLAINISKLHEVDWWKRYTR